MSDLKLNVITDPSRFKAGMDAITKDLHKLRRTTDVVGKGMNKALGAAGLALGFNALARTLKDSARAASEDIKSQALLANSLRNTTGANDDAIKGAEAYIKKTQLSAGVLDDELRPALATAVRATGYLSTGQALLDTALNVSAGTGKDLGTVTNALSKAYTGNTTSLKKLVPGIKTTGDFMGELDKKFAGAAETAAKADPFKRLQIIFASLQETIGMTLLPALETFAQYLASNEGQANLQQVANIFGVIGTTITNATKFLLENLAVVESLVAGLLFLKLSWFAITSAVKIYDIATKIAAVSTKTLKYALISSGIGAIVVAVGTLAAAWLSTKDATDEASSAVDDYASNPSLQSAIQWTNDMRDAIYKQIDDEKKAQEERSKSVREALDAEMGKLKSTAEKFRDTVGIAFGTFGQDENSVFNVDVMIAKLKRVAEAAKGFTENLKKLRKKGADQSFINEIVAMGPAQGNIVAKGLLASGGKLKDILGLRGTLYTAGVGAGGVASTAGNASYEININKAVISANDIIREIQRYEKKTGRKYLVN
jgi:hypothetical protein